MNEHGHTAVLKGGVREAGRQIGLGEHAACKAAARGELPAIRVGHRWIVPRLAWRRFLRGTWSQPNKVGKDQT